ncbi:MAG: acyl-CoA thioesterase [Chloroflexaceae bacterium]|nr:acyl-CoA thioesterase [Chloroflexaceae bacterium]NJO06678.1 acyl-CoA thioesterase [Chloroflexaceae bacterium]
MADLVLPNQTNYYRTMFGGDAMAFMDKAAAIAALRFCRLPIVTASSEHIDFRRPIHEGEIIEALARVIYAGHSSLVVRVHVYGEKPLAAERRLCTTGYFNMVAIGANGERLPVPCLLLEDEQARCEWAMGERIHDAIKERRSRGSTDRLLMPEAPPES